MKLLLLLSFLVLFGCLTMSTKINDINKNPEKYIGEKITVSGVVKNPIKIGKLSGFSLVENEDKIAISSDVLPNEGKTVIVSGTLMKDALFGYYILAKEVN